MLPKNDRIREKSRLFWTQLSISLFYRILVVMHQKSKTNTRKLIFWSLLTASVLQCSLLILFMADAISDNILGSHLCPRPPFQASTCICWVLVLFSCAPPCLMMLVRAVLSQLLLGSPWEGHKGPASLSLGRTTPQCHLLQKTLQDQVEVQLYQLLPLPVHLPWLLPLCLVTTPSHDSSWAILSVKHLHKNLHSRLCP